MSEAAPLTIVGRYVLHATIARGGMATVHLARLLGAQGFSRIVAAKRLHPQFADDAEFVAMFLDEARIASKVHHPNVVPVLDVVHTGTEVILVQEYVHGVPLDKLLRAARERQIPVPPEIVVALGADVLAGLHAAHEARDELGASLKIVHRDVSPQNVQVGVDGIARILDFGVAKATLNAHVTRAGTLKGKLAYFAPEQIRGEVTRAIDLYAAGIVLWEALAGRRLHAGLSEVELIDAVASGNLTRLVDAVDPAEMPPERWAELVRLDRVLVRAMALAPEDRWGTAHEMGDALVAAVPPAPRTAVSRWVRELGNAYLEGRERLLVTEESTWRERRSFAPDGDVEESRAALLPPSSARPVAALAPRSEAGDTLRPSAVPVIERRRRRRFESAVVAALVVIGGMLAGVLVMLLRGPTERTAAAPPPVLEPAPALTLPADAAAPPASGAPGAAPPPAETAQVRGWPGVPASSRPPLRPFATPPKSGNAPPSSGGGSTLYMPTSL
jgi:serine/threonine-protein kinase